VFIAALVLVPLGLVQPASAHDNHIRKVQIPAEDRFAPYALTIEVGDVVKWSNGDEDDHTVVSIDPFNTAGHKGTNQLIPADGGTFMLRFNHPGAFVYYCRFHAQLDGFNQPMAPGPDGGIQGENGNYGTPMSGVIIVVPGD
jgi:plastocyanin